MPTVCLQNGRTALHRASDYGHLAVVEVLLEANADVNAGDKVRFVVLWCG